MNDGWLITNAPSPKHAAWSASGPFLFASPAWAGILESLGATSLYAWSPSKETGIVIPVFRRLGFRIGFLGFPIAGEALDNSRAEEIRLLARRVLDQGHLAIIRATQSSQNDLIETADAARPDVWIDNLTVWKQGNKRLRRDLAFAKRAASDLKIIDGLNDPQRCFELYAATVTAHGGTIKYTAGYFAKLACLPRSTKSIETCSAVDETGVTRGFAVMARHGTCAYYLHSAVDDVAKRKGIGDLLLEHLVCRANSTGCKRFSLMSSPWNQPGLVKFKEKWGNVRGLATTHDFGRGLAGVCLRAISRWQSRHDRRAAMNWENSK